MGAVFWWNFWNAVIFAGIVCAIIGLTVWVRRRNRGKRDAGTH